MGDVCDLFREGWRRQDKNSAYAISTKLEKSVFVGPRVEGDKCEN